VAIADTRQGFEESDLSIEYQFNEEVRNLKFQGLQPVCYYQGSKATKELEDINRNTTQISKYDENAINQIGLVTGTQIDGNYLTAIKIKTVDEAKALPIMKRFPNTCKIQWKGKNKAFYGLYLTDEPFTGKRRKRINGVEVELLSMKSKGRGFVVPIPSAEPVICKYMQKNQTNLTLDDITPIDARILEFHLRYADISDKNLFMPLGEGSKYQNPKKRNNDTGWQTKPYGPNDYKPGANVAIRTGLEAFSGKYVGVIDIDRNYKDNKDEIDELVKQFPETVMVETGGRHQGIHLWTLTDKPVYSASEGEFEFKGLASSGKPQYVLMPPSECETGYQVIAPKEENFVEFEKVAFMPASTLVKMLEEVLGIKTTVADDGNDTQQTDQPTPESILNNEETGTNTAEDTEESEITVAIEYEDAVRDLLNGETKQLKLSMSKILMEKIVAEQYKKMYDRVMPNNRSKTFKCCLHKEEKPSANIVKSNKGQWFYKCFHNRSNTVEYEKNGEHKEKGNSVALDAVKLYRALETGEIKQELSDQENTDASKKLYDYIDQNGIKTEFHKVASNIIDKKLKEVESFLPRYVKEIMVPIKDRLLEQINKGVATTIAPVRDICRRLNLDSEDKNCLKKINKVINMCCVLGILEKGDDVDTKEGKTPEYRIRMFTEEEIRQKWEKMKADGIANYKKINKENIAKVFGKEIANSVIRRDKPEEKQKEKAA